MEDPRVDVVITLENHFRETSQSHGTRYMGFFGQHVDVFLVTICPCHRPHSVPRSLLSPYKKHP